MNLLRKRQQRYVGIVVAGCGLANKLANMSATAEEGCGPLELDAMEQKASGTSCSQSRT